MKVSDERIMASFQISICDALSTLLLEHRAIVLLLERKGVFSYDEYQQAKAAIPPEKRSEWASEIRTKVQERMAALLEQPGGSGNVQ